MATRKSISKTSAKNTFSGDKLKVCIVVSQWHKDITDALLEGTFQVFEKTEIAQLSMEVINVPGSYELPLGAQWAINTYSPDAVICLGCIIRGETPHFDFISKAVADGIMHLNLSHNIPVIFGVLTTDTVKQALQRSGGKHGNKGADAAAAVLEMVELRNKLKQAHAAKS
jgi:6,7-dimethyl-8-ribityllumazine synthase